MSLEWPEYLAVTASLALSIWVGLNSKNKDKNEPDDEFIANKVPLGSIIISLIAAETSGVSMLGKPAEAYMYGMEFFYIYSIAALGCLLFSIFVFVPILNELNTPTLYDVIFSIALSLIFYTGTSIIPPSVVINQFCGVNMEFIILSFSSITIFYTALGGLKGVVRTDVLQGIVMFISMGIMTAASVHQVGGFHRIMTLAYDTGRTQLPSASTADLSARSSIWVYFAFLYAFSPVVLNHSNYQRIKNLSAEKKRVSILFLILGMVLMSLAATFTGLALYTFFYGCDPKENKLISSYSNLVVYWLNLVGNKFVGIRGVYIAGITCASISSMSTHMNSSADLLCKEVTRKWNNLDETTSLRCLTVAVGILGSAFALYFKRSGSLVELSYCVAGIEGVISSLFIMGSMFVAVNSTGALTGGICSLVFTLIVSLGSRIFHSGYELQYGTKIMNMDLCPRNYSEIASTTQVVLKTIEKPFFLFTISPFCVGTLAVVICLVVGLVVSLIFPEKNSLARDSNLYAPFVRRYVVRGNRRKTNAYESIRRQLDINEKTGINVQIIREQ